jgi:ribose 5-phosphate isomerase B
MKNIETVAIGSDHAGFDMKEFLKESLISLGFVIMDYGTYSNKSVDYPDIAHNLAKDVEIGKYRRGILICGSGNGVAMVANKYIGVRAAICWCSEITELARLHNDANIMVLPGRFISNESALEYLKIFFNTGFEGGRHQRRVEKIGLK